MMWNIFSSKESYAAFWETPESGLSKTQLVQEQAGHTLRQALQRMPLGKLASPELKAFVGCHGFKLCNGVKAVALPGIVDFSVDGDHFVVYDVGLAANGAAVEKSVSPCHGLVAVESMYRQGVSVLVDRGDTLDSHGADFFDVKLSAAENTDNVGLFSVDAVLF